MQYTILGDNMPVVECQLAPGEAMKTEAGSMTWMSANMKMETGTGGGGIGKVFGRMLAGESMFQNKYTAQGGPGSIAFGSSFPGSIRAFQITPGRAVICQKSAFLASEMGVDISMHFQKKMMTGLFGGEGFVMQRLSGNGIVFVEIDGDCVERDLAPGESILISTGNLAVMDESCTIDVQTVKGVKNMLLGGEAFFLTKVTGPGRVVLQTMTIAGFASALSPFFTSGNQ